MRVLWFTNIMLPAMDARTGRKTRGSGHWMTMLAEALATRPEIELTVATATAGAADLRFEERGIGYAVIGQRGGDAGLGNRGVLGKCRDLVEQWRPDLVHIHGTERFYGLLAARRMITAPTVISIQGLVGACLRVHYGGLTPLKIFWRADRLRELLRGRGILWGWRALAKLARQEREIIEGNRYFIGRTDWDRAQIESMNGEARYFQGGEMLRPAFHSRRWTIKGCQPRTIMCTNAGQPRRGTETLLEAVAILKRDFPDVRLRLAGELPERSGWTRYLERRIGELGLGGQVDRLGYLDAERLAEALRQSHVFACPSLIENSPNSLGEAMLVGLPCVASYAGGIPSLIEDGKTGVLCPPGDAAAFAGQIRKLFTEDYLSCPLSIAAHDAARRRHDPDRVVGQTVAAYRAVIQNYKLQIMNEE